MTTSLNDVITIEFWYNSEIAGGENEHISPEASLVLESSLVTSHSASWVLIDMNSSRAPVSKGAHERPSVVYILVPEVFKCYARNPNPASHNILTNLPSDHLRTHEVRSVPGTACVMLISYKQSNILVVFVSLPPPFPIK